MRHRTLFAGALALVSTGLAAGAASQEAQVERFTLVAPDTEQTRLDLGRRGPSQGDLFIFSGPLRGGFGRERGRLDGHCITVGVPVANDREEDRRQCFITSTIGTANGETEIQAAGVGRILAEDVALSITGGTNRFQKARGQVLLDYRTRGRVTLTYEVVLSP